MIQQSADQDVGTVGRLWLPLADAARQLGLQTYMLLRIAFYGGVAIRRPGPRRWEIALHPGWSSGCDLYDAYVSGIAEWDHHVSYAHKRIRIHAQVPCGHPVPRGLDEFVLSLGPVSRLKQFELLAYYTESQSGRGENQKRLLDMNVERFEKARRPQDRPPCDLGTVLHRFPWLDLPDTAAADGDGESPDDKWLGSAMCMKHIPELACTLHLLLADRGEGWLRRLGVGLEHLDAKLKAMGIAGSPSSDEVLEALNLILDEAEDALTDKRWSRVSGTRNLLVGLRLAAIYAKARNLTLDPIGPLLDRTIHGNRTLRDRLRTIEREEGHRYRRNRRQEAEEITDRLAEFELSTLLRHEQIAGFVQDLGVAKIAAEEHFIQFDRGQESEPYFDFLSHSTVLDEDGRLVPGCSQLVRWRLWREKDLWRSLGNEEDFGPPVPGLSEADRMALLSAAGIDKSLRKSEKDNAESDRLVVEYIDCEPMHGNRVSEPFIVPLYRLGVITVPTDCPPEVQTARLDFMEQNELPALSGRQLFGYRQGHYGIARWAREFGRAIIPLEELGIGMDMARIGIRIIAATLARRSEILQIRQDTDCFRSGCGPEADCMAFHVVPKGQDEPDAYLISEDLFVDCMRLARTIAESGGDEDGYLSSLKPARSLASKLSFEAPYLFQWEGRAIEADLLSYLISLLGMGHGKITLHLLRRANANALRQRGVPEPVVQQLLKHRSVATTRYYAEKTARQRGEKVEVSIPQLRLIVRDTKDHLDRIRKSTHERRYG